jgi:hypothetical protein
MRHSFLIVCYWNDTERLTLPENVLEVAQCRNNGALG